MATANVEIIIKTTSAKAAAEMKKFTKGFSDGMKNVEKSAKGASKSMKTVTGGIKGVGKALTNMKVIAVAAFIGWGIKRVIGEFTQLAQVQARAEASMKQVMKSMGSFTQEAFQANLDLAQSLQKASRFGDEALLESMKVLQTYKEVTTDNLGDVMTTTMDLATFLGGGKQGLQRATQIMGKAILGLTGPLKLAGISLSDATMKSKNFRDIMREIMEQVGGQARADLNALGGAVDQLGNSWGDVKEKIGAAIQGILDAVARTLLPEMENLNEALTEMFTGETWDQVAISIGESIGGALLDVYNFVKDNMTIWEAFFDIVKAGWKVFTTVVEVFWKVFKKIVEAFKWILETSKPLWKPFFKLFGDGFEDANRAMKPVEKKLKSIEKITGRTKKMTIETTVTGPGKALIDEKTDTIKKKVQVELFTKTEKATVTGVGSDPSITTPFERIQEEIKRTDKTSTEIHKERMASSIRLHNQHMATLEQIASRESKTIEGLRTDLHDVQMLRKTTLENWIARFTQEGGLTFGNENATRLFQLMLGELEALNALGIKINQHSLDQLITIMRDMGRQKLLLTDLPGLPDAIGRGVSKYMAPLITREMRLGDPEATEIFSVGVEKGVRKAQQPMLETMANFPATMQDIMGNFVDNVDVSLDKHLSVIEEKTSIVPTKLDELKLEVGQGWIKMGDRLVSVAEQTRDKVAEGIKAGLGAGAGGTAWYIDAKTGIAKMVTLTGETTAATKRALDLEKEQLAEEKKQTGESKKQTEESKKTTSAMKNIVGLFGAMRGQGGAKTPFGVQGSFGKRIEFAGPRYVIAGLRAPSGPQAFSDLTGGFLEWMKGGGSDYVIEFKGKGSTTRPLGDKIDEMWNQMKGFNNLVSKGGTQLLDFGDATGQINALLEVSSRMSDLQARIMFFTKVHGGVQSPAYFAEVRELQRLRELYEALQTGGIGVGGIVSGGVQVTFGNVIINTQTISDPVALAQQIDGAIADEIKYGRSKITGALQEVGL